VDAMNRTERWAAVGVVVAALVISIATVRPYASGWNDASRLATVEMLVDRGSLIIDDSIFVLPDCEPSPYEADDIICRSGGTGDKLLIDGHYYSDKSPLPAFGMAPIYQVWRWAGGPTAAERPDHFCWLINFTAAGLPYVFSVWCLFAIAGRLGLDLKWRLLFTAFFAIGTVALPYAQQVNNHILLIAVAAWLFLVLIKCNQEGWTVWRTLGIGSLLGIGYTIDLAAGPMLCVTIGAMLLLERTSRRRFALVVLAGLPWFLFHHIVNYRMGGTFGPANAVPEYLAWPGSAFDASNMTGGLKPRSLDKTIIYALDMLFGKKGFLAHNLMLLLPLVMLPWLIVKRYPERRIVLAGLAWATGTWLLYAATSTNLSGACCSVRWLVPLVVPGFVALAIVLRDWPSTHVDALILGAGSMMFGCCMAYCGPWYRTNIYGFWAFYISTLVVWGGYRTWRWVRRRNAMRGAGRDISNNESAAPCSPAADVDHCGAMTRIDK
jgi:hypothetical protein